VAPATLPTPRGQVALEHVEAGEKVLIGSDLIETGRWLCERLREKGVEAAHIVEERSGRAQTMNPRRRAKAIEACKTGRTQVLCCGIPSIRLGHSLEAASCVIANGLVFSYEMFDQFIAAPGVSPRLALSPSTSPSLSARWTAQVGAALPEGEGRRPRPRRAIGR